MSCLWAGANRPWHARPSPRSEGGTRRGAVEITQDSARARRAAPTKFPVDSEILLPHDEGPGPASS